MRSRSVVAAVVLAFAARAHAQTAVVSGTVFRDSASNALGGAIVSLPALNRSARTNYLGEFRIDRVPAGTHVVSIKFVGIAPFTDSVSVVNGQTLEREFILKTAPVVLDSQRVVEKRELNEPHLAEFEERRKLGAGHFIDTEALRKIEGGRPLMNYLSSSIPGLKTYRPDARYRPTDWYLSGGHGARRFLDGQQVCPISIYMDGVAYYVPLSTLGPPPDVSQLSPQDFSGVEYYANGATAPPHYNMGSGGCGVLMLWRRYKR